MIITVLTILMLIIAITIIISKNNFKLVIFSSSFSLLASILYFVLGAPDVSLAEISIGSAIVPLIFIIAISKQKDFIVVTGFKDNYFSIDEKGHMGEGYRLLYDFCIHYDLKLQIYSNLNDDIHGVFRKDNIDLIISKSIETEHYLLTGKKSSILIKKLEQMSKDFQNIKVVKVSDYETID